MFASPLRGFHACLRPFADEAAFELCECSIKWKTSRPPAVVVSMDSVSDAKPTSAEPSPARIEMR